MICTTQEIIFSNRVVYAGANQSMISGNAILKDAAKSINRKDVARVIAVGQGQHLRERHNICRIGLFATLTPVHPMGTHRWRRDT